MNLESHSWHCRGPKFPVEPGSRLAGPGAAAKLRLATAPHHSPKALEWPKACSKLKWGACVSARWDTDRQWGTEGAYPSSNLDATPRTGDGLVKLEMPTSVPVVHMVTALVSAIVPVFLFAPRICTAPRGETHPKRQTLSLILCCAAVHLAITHGVVDTPSFVSNFRYDGNTRPANPEES